MLPNSNNNKNNLKLMIISSSILLALFVYTIFKSSVNIQNSNYYLGIVFLLFLMLLAFGLHFFREKLKPFLSKEDKVFAQELESQKELSKESKHSLSSDSIEPIKSDIKFSDVAGIKNTKAELSEIVDFLNNPKKYLKYGVKLPKGVLLVGSPGVGKTLVARAVAGEANVPFFYQSGASFVHIYVGMGAKKVRELFAKAKSVAPAVIFIDEIDAIGKKRTGLSNDEREATLNELLTAMDGFEGDNSVVVIAATNKIEVLDEALLRAGRFDRRVFLSLPSYEDRLEILKLYLKNKTHNINIEELASSTYSFSSSALSTLINEALLHMIRRGGVSLLEDDIQIAKSKLEFGLSENQFLTKEELEITAISKATKRFFDKYKNLQHKSIKSKQELVNLVKYYLSSSIALDIIKKESFTIDEADIQEAYNIAYKMKENYKMIDSVDEFITKTKLALKEEILSNIEEILDIKKSLEDSGEVL